MAVSLFAGCGTEWASDYEWSEHSFFFEVVANKTEARMGDEVVITATFKNLSGYNLRITVPEWRRSMASKILLLRDRMWDGESYIGIIILTRARLLSAHGI